MTSETNVSAYHLDAGFTAMEEGERVGRIELRSDGRCTIIDYEDDFSVTGTYDIEENITIGGSTNIYFYINGKTHRGSYVWPIQDKLMTFLWTRLTKWPFGYGPVITDIAGSMREE